MSDEEFSVYLSGEKLYGDDLTGSDIEQWFADEAEGYANLGAGDKKKYRYAYHQLNRQHGFRFLRNISFDKALAIGGAYGDEFQPISKAIHELTIIDPSKSFCQTNLVHGVPCNYVKPCPSGDMPFEDDYFDLITSFGVMHHIPNVTHVIGECSRCLRLGGLMLLREPINSMGDWRTPRKGLTKRERGIPVHILDDIIRTSKLKVIHQSFCMFSPLVRMSSVLGFRVYNSRSITAVDKMLSFLFSRNVKYHRAKLREKFAPAAIFYVLEKIA